MLSLHFFYISYTCRFIISRQATFLTPFPLAPIKSPSRILFAIHKIFSIGTVLGKCRHKSRTFYLASSWSPALPWLKQPWCGFGVLICWAKAQLDNSAAACKAFKTPALTSCPSGCARKPCIGSSVSFTAEPCHVLQQGWHCTAASDSIHRLPWAQNNGMVWGWKGL